MKVTISRDAICAKVAVTAGEYMVALATDTQQMILTGGGKQYKIPAVRRRTSAKTKVATVTFYSGGGNQWSLVVSTPKLGEWIAMMELESKRK